MEDEVQLQFVRVYLLYTIYTSVINWVQLDSKLLVKWMVLRVIFGFLSKSAHVVYYNVKFINQKETNIVEQVMEKNILNIFIPEQLVNQIFLNWII